jgi:hypothetical protein
MGWAFGSESLRSTGGIPAKIDKAATRRIQALGLHPAAIDYEGLIGAHPTVIGG